MYKKKRFIRQVVFLTIRVQRDYIFIRFKKYLYFHGCDLIVRLGGFKNVVRIIGQRGKGNLSQCIDLTRFF